MVDFARDYSVDFLTFTSIGPQLDGLGLGRI